jgi:hypothetical protein
MIRALFTLHSLLEDNKDILVNNKKILRKYFKELIGECITSDTTETLNRFNPSQIMSLRFEEVKHEPAPPLAVSAVSAVSNDNTASSPDLLLGYNPLNPLASLSMLTLKSVTSKIVGSFFSSKQSTTLPEPLPLSPPTQGEIILQALTPVLALLHKNVCLPVSLSEASLSNTLHEDEGRLKLSPRR